MIYLKKNGQKLETNFGKGGMKVFTKKAFKNSSKEASLNKYLSINLKFLKESSSLWSSAMSYAK